MQNGILFVTATMPRSALGVARGALSGAGWPRPPACAYLVGFKMADLINECRSLMEHHPRG
jgi:hypothetical protein